MKLNNNNLLKKYNNNGWVKIEKFLSKKNILKINHNLNKFFASEKKRYSGRDINFVQGKINSFHRLEDSNFIKKNLVKNRNIKKIVEYFLQTKSKFMASELFAKPAKHGLPSPIHQDNYYWCIKNSDALTVWIALDKVSKSNGGICYYEKSHRLGLLKHVPSFAKGSSQKIFSKKILKNCKKVYPDLFPGDALIHHSLIVHGSGTNKSNFSRRGITLQYKAKNSKIDKMLKMNYEKDLKKQIKSRS